VEAEVIFPNAGASLFPRRGLQVSNTCGEHYEACMDDPELVLDGVPAHQLVHAGLPISSRTLKACIAGTYALDHWQNASVARSHEVDASVKNGVLTPPMVNITWDVRK
jgi:hypothetical protein